MHGTQHFNKKKQCQFCEASTDEILTKTLHTRAELFTMKSSIVDFHRDFYIPEIQKLVFQLPHVHIIGTHHCGNMRR